MKNPVMLKVFPDNLKTKKILRFLIRYVSDQYKIQKMNDNVILENGGTLGSVPGCYRNQQICDKAVEN